MNFLNSRIFTESFDFERALHIQEIFSGSDQDGESENEDYEVDMKEISTKVPILIHSSDASQFSAIVDVMDGKNTAIQGPPGTGKSQTISNIIVKS